MFFAEYTDTYGGETNYSWVRRAYIDSALTPYEALKKARAEFGLSGVKGDITLSAGDEAWWKPRCFCTILMVRWDDTPPENRYDAPII